MAEQQPDNTEETYLPSASKVQDFCPPLDKNFPLPGKAKAEGDGEKKPACPSKAEKPAAVVAAAMPSRLSFNNTINTPWPIVQVQDSPRKPPTRAHATSLAQA